ncbi:uncharacterized protein LOC135649299 isoform X1 [Musa acuminata AAA Group]|uniref:uncharacterized protein LOC135649299 isoform X1 n=1 Tax=Musa acuminata AAA Group TaxID=214697 RepID=UPI0031E19D13
MRECCGDPHAVRGLPGGTGEEISGGNQDGVVDGEEFEGLPALKVGGAFTDGNAGAGGQGLENVSGGCSPCDDCCSLLVVVNEHEALVKETKEVEEDSGGFVESGKESNHVVPEQRVSVGNLKTIAAANSIVEVGVLVDANAGVGNLELENANCGFSSCNDRSSSLDIGKEHEVLDKEIKEMEDDAAEDSKVEIGMVKAMKEMGEVNGSFVDAEKRSNNLDLEQGISVENPKAVESCSSLPGKPVGCVCCKRNLVDDKYEDLLLSNIERIECSACKEDILCSNNGNSGRLEPFNSQNDKGLAPSCIVGQKEGVCDVSEENSVSSCIARGLSGVSLDEVTSCFSVEVSSFLQSSALHTAARDHSSDLPLATDCEIKVTDAFNTASTCCSNVKVSRGQVSNGVIGTSKSVPSFASRRTNPKRAASLRSIQTDVRSDHLTRNRNNMRKHNKAADLGTLFSNITDKKIEVRRKRSCFQRMTRKSVWGGTSSLVTHFMENDELAVSSFHLAQIQNTNLKISQNSRPRRKKQMCHGDRNLISPKSECAFLTQTMHLNDQIYLQSQIPNMVDSQHSIEANNDAVPNMCRPSHLGISSKRGEADCKPLTDNLASSERFLRRHGQQGEKDMESTLTQDASLDNMLGECPGVSSHSGSETLMETTVDKHLVDPESSPDSDIYNPVVDVGVALIESGTFQDNVVNQSVIVPKLTVLNGMCAKLLNSCDAIVSPESASSLEVQLQTENKEESKFCEASAKAYASSEEHDLIKEKLHELDIQITDVEPVKYVRKKRNGFKERSHICSDAIKEAKGKDYRGKTYPDNTTNGVEELGCSEGSRKADLGLGVWVLTKQDTVNLQPEDGGLLITDKADAHKLSRSSKKRVGKNKLSLKGSTRSRRPKSHGKKNCTIQRLGKSRKKENNQTLDVDWEACGSLKLPPGRACNKSKPKEGTCGLEGQSLPQRRAWVLCDDCHKWRSIPTELADIIGETNCRWTCKDNTDKAFADCSIPQEKTNSEINAELEISDASCDEGVPKPKSSGFAKSKLAATQPAPWTPIKSNLYLHRNRKSQTIDETMVCHCKPPSDSCLGCGDQCLNRMLNIECGKGTCPCGELCSNQQFQKRKYAKLKWIPCGKKGFGLQSLQDVSSGQFIIEYVGEVLDLGTYEARQRYYASRGQKHFYFMTLNGGEVIDACAKGNLGRFINHSCDPNCRTEKWMVNGEVCIGLFAIRDIKKGEELTFDYNYVRVFGAAAKKCVCGSSVCRGYIGSDPLDAEVIVQDDSDDEILEPMMAHEENEKALDIDVSLSYANDVVEKDSDSSIKNKVQLDDSPLIISETEAHQQSWDTICKSSYDVTPLSITSNGLDKDTISRSISEIQLSEDHSRNLDDVHNKETSTVQPSLTVIDPISGTALKSILASNIIDEQQSVSKPYLAKSSPSNHIIRKSKLSAKAKPAQKAKKSHWRSGNAQFAGVENELNELLDADGGISKRKDATKGYLKLLFVTAAEGDNAGGASQSIRDLSLILDALLKTKSRTVLMDIINKNGLQMLHNIMKQNRSKFNRIPIIRKLLKVLEFLALKGILTPEHINKGPPCSGMESLKDSLLSLTRHNDIQVHQIARSFRDKWIPRTIKRVEPSDRDEFQLDSQRPYPCWFQSSPFNHHLDQGARDSDAIVCVSEPMEQVTYSGVVDMPGETCSLSSTLIDNNTTTRARTRKRKSRWDQPLEYNGPDQQHLWSSQDQATEAGSKLFKASFSELELGSRTEAQKRNLDRPNEDGCSLNGVAGMKNFLQQNMDDEAPPGFESSQKLHQLTSETLVPRGEVVVGYLQERYLSHLGVSYGIPLAFVQKLGTSELKGDTNRHQFWQVAPSMPFHPFPPLPSYPRGKPNPLTLTSDSSKNSTVDQGLNATQVCKLDDGDSQATDVPVPSTIGGRPASHLEAPSRDLQISERTSWSSNSYGRRLFRTHRWNNQKFRRRWSPWPQEGNDHGFRGTVRHRDSGRNFRDERRYWPRWPQEDSGVSSKQM